MLGFYRRVNTLFRESFMIVFFEEENEDEECDCDECEEDEE
jgi:hypothetical protein